MASYGDILSQYAATIQGIQQGYSNLNVDVLGVLQGTEASALQKAKLAFESGQGKILGDLVSRGLGNSTIQGSMETGLLGKYGETTGAIQSDFANKLAAYKSQIGLAALGYRGQAAQAYAALGGQFQSEQDRNALGYAQLAAQNRMAQYGRGGGGGGGIYSEGAPQLKNYGGGGGGGRAYNAGVTYAAGPTAGGYSGFTGTQNLGLAGSGIAYGGLGGYLPDTLSSGGDFGDYYGGYGEY
jgi:hypothetical protein